MIQLFSLILLYDAAMMVLIISYFKDAVNSQLSMWRLSTLQISSAQHFFFSALLSVSVVVWEGLLEVEREDATAA
jgi:hypothetical protein